MDRIDKQDMIEELKRTLDMIETQMDQIDRIAERQPDWTAPRDSNEYVPTITSAEVRLSDGSWPMIPLIAAKAQTLNALAMLVTA